MKQLTTLLTGSLLSLAVTPAFAEDAPIKAADWIYIDHSEYMLTPTRRLGRGSLCQAQSETAPGSNLWSVLCHVRSQSANACEIVGAMLDLDPDNYRNFNFLDLKSPIYSQGQVNEAADVDFKLNNNWGRFAAGEVVVVNSLVIEASSYFGFKSFYADLSDNLFVKDTKGCWTSGGSIHKVTKSLPPRGPQLGQSVVLQEFSRNESREYTLLESKVIGYRQNHHEIDSGDENIYALANGAAVPLEHIFWDRTHSKRRPAEMQDAIMDYTAKKVLKVDDLLGQSRSASLVFFDAKSARWYFWSDDEYNHRFSKLTQSSNKFNVRAGDFIVNGKVSAKPAPHAEKIIYIDDNGSEVWSEQSPSSPYTYVVTESDLHFFVFACDSENRSKGLCAQQAK